MFQTLWVIHSVATTQLCHGRVKADDSMRTKERGCVPIKLYLLKRIVGQFWPKS